MSLDKLWDMYGTAEEPVKEEPVKKESVREKKVKEEPIKTTATRKRESTVRMDVERKRERVIKPDVVPTRAKKASTVGVFGEDVMDRKEEKREERGVRRVKPIRKARSINWNALRDWPWIDIVFITITLGMVAYVLFHFEEITNKLFNCLLLPLLTNLLGLVVFLGILVFAFLLLRDRRYRRGRYY